MKFSEMVSSTSKFLSAKDIEQVKEVQVVIDKYTQEEIENKQGEKELHWVIWFRGKEKGLILKKTNADTLGTIFDSSEAAVGQPIILFWVAETGLGPGIRIREVSAPAAADVPF